MAEVIWAEPALNDLDAIADYIALDNPEAARRLVQKIFEHVDHLQSHPRLGSKPQELKGWRYRQIAGFCSQRGMMCLFERYILWGEVILQLDPH